MQDVSDLLPIVRFPLVPPDLKHPVLPSNAGEQVPANLGAGSTEPRKESLKFALASGCRVPAHKSGRIRIERRKRRCRDVSSGKT